MSTPDAMRSGSLSIGGDLSVARLGFGAMRLTGEGAWGEPEDAHEAKAVLRRAVELGVTLVDTADSYGPEVSERLIAEALRPYPDELVIATKGGLVRPGPDRWERNGRPDHLRMALEGSLTRLRLERIDLYQLHAPDEDVPYAESVGALEQLRQEGKIRHIGISNVDTDQLDTALTEAAVVSVQNRYNIGDRASEPVLQRCVREGIAFLPWSPLARGDLAGKSGPLDRLAHAKGCTPAQIGLAWLLAHASVICPIPGTSSLRHLEENVEAAGIELSPADLGALDAHEEGRERG